MSARFELITGNQILDMAEMPYGRVVWDDGIHPPGPMLVCLEQARAFLFRNVIANNITADEAAAIEREMRENGFGNDWEFFFRRIVVCAVAIQSVKDAPMDGLRFAIHDDKTCIPITHGFVRRGQTSLTN